jgi:hypothetical protein
METEGVRNRLITLLILYLLFNEAIKKGFRMKMKKIMCGNHIAAAQDRYCYQYGDISALQRKIHDIDL